MMRAHQHEYLRGHEPRWVEYQSRPGEVCSWCGSISTLEAIRLLTTSGTRYTGSDWKYGYPHKFYLGNHKFYTEHLLDEESDVVERFNAAALLTLNIQFIVDPERGLGWRAPAHGYQTYGVVP
jgi:hypothetical protein